MTETENELPEIIHRTWVQLLIDNGYSEVASIAIECGIGIYTDYYKHECEICIYIPTDFYRYIIDNQAFQKIMTEQIRPICEGIFKDLEISIIYHVKLLEIENNWKDVVRNFLVNKMDPNQGIVTEKVFLRKKKNIYTYNEMKFGSRAEIRIAQELEKKGVLFFPLPLAVRATTGVHYKDHREPDFLICKDGVWGILEISKHNGRYEEDAEKAIWFTNAGILYIQHYKSENCEKQPEKIVTEFLNNLEKYRR